MELGSQQSKNLGHSLWTQLQSPNGASWTMGEAQSQNVKRYKNGAQWDSFQQP
jgi:hypothetical protein